MRYVAAAGGHLTTYFITGGTGFVGRALVRELMRDESVTEIWLLTRNAQTRYEMLQWDSRIKLYEGDITRTQFPARTFTHVIHAACEANDLLQPDQMAYYYTIVEGMRRILEWASTFHPEFLFVSSGVVHKGETVYCNAKRACEMMGAASAVQMRIARVYSLVGEEMPLNGQYALGRFISGARYGRVRYYRSDAVRSYLHVEDCARWLLTILSNGITHYPYDVGSDLPVMINDLAALVGEVWRVPVSDTLPPEPHSTARIYVPDVSDARRIGCVETLSLRKALERMRDAV